MVDVRWWDIEEMDVSNINSDNFGKRVDGKGKRFDLFCVFKINWNCWIFLKFLTSLLPGRKTSIVP